MSHHDKRPWNSFSEEDVLSLLATIQKRSPWITKWRVLKEFIRPYEHDWRSYTDTTKYNGVVTMEVHPHLAKHGSLIKMQEGLLKLGFIRMPDRATHFVLDAKRAQEKVERMKVEKRRQQGILTGSTKQKQHVTWHIPKEGAMAADSANESASLLSVSQSGDQTSFCGTSASDDISESAVGMPSDAQTDAQSLKDQVSELTRQVRMLRAASLSFTPKPVVPYIMQSNYWSPTSGHQPVRLQVNYLDPDLAPYRVAIQLKTRTGYDWCSPPCTVVDHQYIVFLAPPSPPGSCPVTLFGTTGSGGLKKYCQSAWMEYRVVDTDEDGSLGGGDTRTVSLNSCIKGSRKVKPDRKSSIASAASSAQTQRQIQQQQLQQSQQGALSSSSQAHPQQLQAPSVAFGDGQSSTGRQTPTDLDASARQEVTLSLPPRREGLTHHQINEHNALNILPSGGVVGDASEGPDTFDPTSDLKSHSEMKSEFTSDIADDDARDEEDEEVWQTRQFRALLPKTEYNGTEHPPLTKEMLELLTLGHGWDSEELVKSCMSLSASASKTVNFMMSKGGNTAASRSAGGTTSLRSTSPVYGQPSSADAPQQASSSSPTGKPHQGAVRGSSGSLGRVRGTGKCHSACSSSSLGSGCVKDPLAKRAATSSVASFYESEVGGGGGGGACVGTPPTSLPTTASSPLAVGGGDTTPLPGAVPAFLGSSCSAPLPVPVASSSASLCLGKQGSGSSGCDGISPSPLANAVSGGGVQRSAERRAATLPTSCNGGSLTSSADQGDGLTHPTHSRADPCGKRSGGGMGGGGGGGVPREQGSASGSSSSCSSADASSSCAAQGAKVQDSAVGNPHAIPEYPVKAEGGGGGGGGGSGGGSGARHGGRHPPKAGAFGKR